MAKIWIWVVTLTSVYGIASGRGSGISEALMSCGKEAVGLTITLMCVMMVWSGMMEILNEAGDLKRIGRWLMKLFKPCCADVDDDDAWAAIGMHMAANFMGLGNAATPAGIEAANRLARFGEPGLRVLSMMLVIDHAGLQLIPTTVIAMRGAAQSSDPSGIWLQTILVSLVMAFTGVSLLLVFRRGGKRIGSRHHRRRVELDTHSRNVRG